MNRREAIAALTALPGLGRVAQADIKPDDVIVVETTEHMSADAADRIGEAVRRVWPTHRVLVLQHGLSLKVVSARDIG